MSMVLNTEASLNKPSVWQPALRTPGVVYFAVLALLTAALFVVMGNISYADDLLKAGKAAVNDTVGKDSSVMQWLLMLEVLSAIFGYIATRNLKVLGGIVALSIFINICYSIIGS
ncbi:hypothetical protein NMD07_25615 (plasmid) [Citrobacter cronae]